MQRSDSSEGNFGGSEIQGGKNKLEGGPEAYRHPNDTPQGGSYGKITYTKIVIAELFNFRHGKFNWIVGDQILVPIVRIRNYLF